MRFTVDPWDPSYGSSLDTDLAASVVDVNTDVELSASSWRPIRPSRPASRPAVLFVDGVRRVEAHGWIQHEQSHEPALFASYAAGAVHCCDQAELADVTVLRGVFAASAAVADVHTRAGSFTAAVAADSSPEHLSLALQQAMTAAEVATAERARRRGDDLVVVDGPLRGRQHLPFTVGLVKTHHVGYLPDQLNAVVEELVHGERTPLFLVRSSWARVSWYLRLPGPVESPWGSVVRCEARAELAPAEAAALADLVSASLPSFASTPHKDGRAPQNLFPIAGLERELRRRLGDSAIVYRALRRASRGNASVAAPASGNGP